jgi:hypothetical protein
MSTIKELTGRRGAFDTNSDGFTGVEGLANGDSPAICWSASGCIYLRHILSNEAGTFQQKTGAGLPAPYRVNSWVTLNQRGPGELVKERGKIGGG